MIQFFNDHRLTILGVCNVLVIVWLWVEITHRDPLDPPPRRR